MRHGLGELRFAQREVGRRPVGRFEAPQALPILVGITRERILGGDHGLGLGNVRRGPLQGRLVVARIDSHQDVVLAEESATHEFGARHRRSAPTLPETSVVRVPGATTPWERTMKVTGSRRATDTSTSSETGSAAFGTAWGRAAYSNIATPNGTDHHEDGKKNLEHVKNRCPAGHRTMLLSVTSNGHLSADRARVFGSSPPRGHRETGMGDDKRRPYDSSATRPA